MCLVVSCCLWCFACCVGGWWFVYCCLGFCVFSCLLAPGFVCFFFVWFDSVAFGFVIRLLCFGCFYFVLGAYFLICCCVCSFSLVCFIVFWFVWCWLAWFSSVCLCMLDLCLLVVWFCCDWFDLLCLLVFVCFSCFLVWVDTFGYAEFLCFGFICLLLCCFSCLWVFVCFGFGFIRWLVIAWIFGC